MCVCGAHVLVHVSIYVCMYAEMEKLLSVSAYTEHVNIHVQQ